LWGTTWKVFVPGQGHSVVQSSRRPARVPARIQTPTTGRQRAATGKRENEVVRPGHGGRWVSGTAQWDVPSATLAVDGTSSTQWAPGGHGRVDGMDRTWGVTWTWLDGSGGEVGWWWGESWHCWEQQVVRRVGVERAARGTYLGYLPVLCVEGANGKPDPRQGFVGLANLCPGSRPGSGQGVSSEGTGGSGAKWRVSDD
jgi:hypothetical protein